MAITALKILMYLGEKLRREDDDEVNPEPIPKECRICWGGDEDGEDWVAPCYCPRAVVWAHRSCIQWRLKHTKIEEDNLRCAVCKHAYKKILRLKSFREWFDSWRGDMWALQLDLYCLWCTLGALLIFRYRAWFLEEEMPLSLYVHVILPEYTLAAAASIPLRIYAAYRVPARFGLSLYKRFLAVAVQDWVLDAHSSSAEDRQVGRWR